MKKQILTAVASAGIFLSLYGGEAKADSNSYMVQSGDTLWKIATNNHVTVDDIKTWNQLSSNNIYVGQSLTVNRTSHEDVNAVITYTVKSGDSLSVIAKNFGTTVNAIKALNNLTTDKINIGQVLKVTPETSEPIPPKQSLSTYTVKSGDSLSLIAKNNQLTVTELKSYNGLTTDKIYVGQVLKFASATSEPIPPKQSLSTYTVKSGDSLSLIAKNNQLTVTELKTYNGLSTDSIYVGQVLKLTKPAGTTKVISSPDALISEAKKYIGVPYVWGGSTPSGFDCSGFLNYVYNKQGISIPRTVATIWNATTAVSSPQKGDIVFFYTTSSTTPSHAGIYIGNNQFIHASSSKGVMISDMNNVYWKPLYAGAKKFK